jgi:hypothetical protein
MINLTNNIGMSIRKLIKDGLVMKRMHSTIHSRSRARRHLDAVRRGQ